MATSKTWVYVDMPGIAKNSYRIYPSGKVYSEKVGKFISPTKNSKGYKCMHLVTEDGGRKQEFIHRLLAYAFIKRTDRDTKYHRDFVHFIDFDKSDLSVTNLQFVNEAELWIKVYIHNHPDEFKTLVNYADFIRRLYNRGYEVEDIIDVLELKKSWYTKSVIGRIITTKKSKRKKK